MAVAGARASTIARSTMAGARVALGRPGRACHHVIGPTDHLYLDVEIGLGVDIGEFFEHQGVGIFGAARDEAGPRDEAGAARAWARTIGASASSISLAIGAIGAGSRSTGAGSRSISRSILALDLARLEVPKFHRHRRRNVLT